jgi:nitrate reductase delta subunit
MNRVYKALAALLAYPTPELIEALPDIGETFDRERALGHRERLALHALVDELAGADLLDAQERYVTLFDRGRATSLHLFEHLHGDSRERGQAMVDLNSIYRRAGLELAANELPDYLPVLLEFASLQPRGVVRELIGDCAHIVRSIGEALSRRASRYAAIMDAALTLAGEPGLDAKPAREAEPERSLDDEWIEEPVIFGPEAATNCGAKTRDSASAVVRFMPRGAPPRP